MNPVDELVSSIAEATLQGCTAFGPDAVMDATVPQWRFAVHGAEGIRRELAKWFPVPGRMDAVRRAPLPTGEFVEFCRTWDEPEGPISVHQAYAVDVDGDQITSIRVWCGGRWTAGELAEMAAAQEQADAAR